MKESVTVRQALDAFYIKHHLPCNGGYDAKSWAFYKIGRFQLRLPNFKWRQRAVPYHDIHHLITGYKCNPAGEMQMAAWEYAAGRFPHVCATLFCLPLVSMGAVLFPIRTFKAFVRGSRSRTLYSMEITDALLDTDLQAIRAEMLPAEKIAATPSDYIAYFKLAIQSASIILSPAAAAAAMYYLVKVPS
ncbi:MAG: hypothetical protein ACAH83_11570 [Alphaproteobacteria bacterium]